MITNPELNKVNKQLNKISKDLVNKHKSISKAVEKVMLVEANNLRNYIIESMQKTPRAGWSYKRRSVTHHPSLPGNPPAIDTGELIRSILYDVKDMEMRIGNIGGAPYGVALEDPDNTRKSGRRKWLLPAVTANEKQILENIKAAVKKEFGKV